MERHLIDKEATIAQGLHKLNALSGGIMTLFVINAQRQVCGTLTDGDIRRALISGAQLSDPVAEIMHRQFRAVIGDTIDVSAIKSFREFGIKMVPWLEEDGTIRSIVDLSENHTILPISAILMAGGKGERLRPLTNTIPKPLLKIGDKAIIDYNIEALIKCGISDITVTTRYLADQIKEHFKTPIGDIKVRCVEETIPLGTIGAAALVELPKDGYTLVMNSDLLTTISFEDMYLHHINSNADITIAVIPYQISVPYAILTTGENGYITGIEEKPSLSFFANAGIYIFPNELLKSLPTDQRTDATDLIQDAIKKGKKVIEFPINGTWIDVGSPTDFKQATELIKYVQKSRDF